MLKIIIPEIIFLWKNLTNVKNHKLSENNEN